MQNTKFNSRFPEELDCLKILEDIFWGNYPQCPYCKSHNCSPRKCGKRYQCITCNSSYSVTVYTIFHKTKIDYRKWFFVIFVFLDGTGKINISQLSKDIRVNRGTLKFMISRITKELQDKPNFLLILYARIKKLFQSSSKIYFKAEEGQEDLLQPLREGHEQDHKTGNFEGNKSLKLKLVLDGYGRQIFFITDFIQQNKNQIKEE